MRLSEQRRTSKNTTTELLKIRDARQRNVL